MTSTFHTLRRCAQNHLRLPAPVIAGAIAAAAGPSGLAQDVHGPFAVWYRDPTSTVSVQWLHRVHADRDTVPGHEGSWATGTGGFGYDDGDDRTTFEMSGRFARVYIRTGFAVPSGVPDDAELVLRVLYDDGFVAYLNGREVARSQVGSGSGAGARETGDHEAGNFEAFSLGKAGDHLASATNILAVEGHNHSIDSSDFSLHPVLAARTKADSPDGPGKPLVDNLARWEYLANAEPDPGWTNTLASTAPDPEPEPPADTAANQAQFKLEVRATGSANWSAIGPSVRPFADTGNDLYSADLTGLAPDTDYELHLTRTGADGLSVTRSVRTAPATLDRPLKFVTGGDMFHRRAALDAMNSQCAKRDPLFAFLGGDLAYANGRTASRWYDWIDSWSEHCVSSGRMIPMVVAIGNHEVDGGDQPRPPRDAKFFYSLFALPDGKSNYAVDFGDYLSIIALDSDHTQKVAEQSRWLAETLAARGDVPYVFPGYHRPAFGTGVKDDIRSIRDEWVPLFQDHHVELVFENDHHVYKRTKPLTLQGGEAVPAPEDGVVYIGDGAWGVDVREIPESAAQLGYLERWASTNHLLEVTLDGTSTRVAAIDAEGVTFDETTIPLRRPR
jgi:hypothetical protein